MFMKYFKRFTIKKKTKNKMAEFISYIQSNNRISTVDLW